LNRPQGDNPLGVICRQGADADRITAWYLLDSLIERAAKLVAAMLASTVLKTGSRGCDPTIPVCITADGTTFYELKSLKKKTEYYLTDFLEKNHGRFIEIVNVDNAPLIGAAIAGLTN
jgi:hexokinase